MSDKKTEPHVHGPDCDHDHDHNHDHHSHNHSQHGHVHGPHCNHGPQVPFVRASAKVGRNDPCTCGSGQKFKKCCGKN